MPKRILTSVWIGCLSLCSLANAALYELTLKGEVTQTTWPNVSVGDPFTIRYTADSEDRQPSPTFGGYAVTPAMLILPNATITSYGPQTGLSVRLNLVGGRDVVSYRSADLADYDFHVELQFPAGTLASDALPLALPMQNATSAQLVLTDFKAIYGSIVSYEGVEVPEPRVLGALLLLFTLSRRALSIKKPQFGRVGSRFIAGA